MELTYAGQSVNSETFSEGNQQLVAAFIEVLENLKTEKETLEKHVQESLKRWDIDMAKIDALRVVINNRLELVVKEELEKPITSGEDLRSIVDSPIKTPRKRAHKE